MYRCDICQAEFDYIPFSCGFCQASLCMSCDVNDYCQTCRQLLIFCEACKIPIEDIKVCYCGKEILKCKYDSFTCKTCWKQTCSSVCCECYLQCSNCEGWIKKGSAKQCTLCFVYFCSYHNFQPFCNKHEITCLEEKCKNHKSKHEIAIRTCFITACESPFICIRNVFDNACQDHTEHCYICNRWFIKTQNLFFKKQNVCFDCFDVLKKFVWTYKGYLSKDLIKNIFNLL